MRLMCVLVVLSSAIAFAQPTQEQRNGCDREHDRRHAKENEGLTSHSILLGVPTSFPGRSQAHS